MAGSAAEAYSPADSVDFGKNLAIALILFALGAAGVGMALIDGLVSPLRAVINVRRMNGTISEVRFAQDEAL